MTYIYGISLVCDYCSIHLKLIGERFIELHTILHNVISTYQSFICCCCFTWRIYRSNGHLTIVGERLQNAGLLQSLSREGSLSCHACCDTGPRFFGLILRTAPLSRLLQGERGIGGLGGGVVFGNFDSITLIHINSRQHTLFKI